MYMYMNGYVYMYIYIYQGKTQGETGKERPKGLPFPKERLRRGDRISLLIFVHMCIVRLGLKDLSCRGLNGSCWMMQLQWFNSPGPLWLCFYASYVWHYMWCIYICMCICIPRGDPRRDWEGKIQLCIYASYFNFSLAVGHDSCTRDMPDITLS